MTSTPTLTVAQAEARVLEAARDRIAIERRNRALLTAENSLALDEWRDADRELQAAIVALTTADAREAATAADMERAARGKDGGA